MISRYILECLQNYLMKVYMVGGGGKPECGGSDFVSFIYFLFFIPQDAYFDTLHIFLRLERRCFSQRQRLSNSGGILVGTVAHPVGRVRKAWCSGTYLDYAPSSPHPRAPHLLLRMGSQAVGTVHGRIYIWDRIYIYLV